MSATTTAAPSSGGLTGSSVFWGGLWRTAGAQSVGLFVVAYLVYGQQPQLGASADMLVALYTADRMRILIAAVLGGFAVLNLMWFAAAIRATLADAGQDGWGAAAIASSAAVGALLILLISVSATLAYSVGDSGTRTLIQGANNFAWAGAVLSSFPRAMLIMSATFGLWRAGLISSRTFTVGVAVVVLVLLGGTTWAANGLWAPDGAYSRIVSPILGLLWILVVTAVLLKRAPPPRVRW